MCHMRRIVAMACAVGALTTLAACGYKGPLTLPEQQARLVASACPLALVGTPA